MKTIISALLLMASISTAQASCEALLKIATDKNVAIEEINASKDGKVSIDSAAKYAVAQEALGFLKGFILAEGLDIEDQTVAYLFTSDEMTNNIINGTVMTCAQDPSQDLIEVLIANVEKAEKLIREYVEQATAQQPQQ